MAKLAITYDDPHIFRLIDGTGMYQHSQFSVPDPAKGYTTDDNARAMIAAVCSMRIVGNSG